MKFLLIKYNHILLLNSNHNYLWLISIFRNHLQQSANWNRISPNQEPIHRSINSPLTNISQNINGLRDSKLYKHEFAKALTIDFSPPRRDGNGARLFVFPLNYVCMNYFVVRSGSCITCTIHFRVEVKCVSASRWDEDGSIYILGETERDGQRQIGVRGNIEISIRQMHTGDACVFMLEKFFFYRSDKGNRETRVERVINSRESAWRLNFIPTCPSWCRFVRRFSSYIYMR